MTIDEAEKFLDENYETIEAAYKDVFGDIMSFANPRVEAVSCGSVTVSCHYNGFDDYHDRCGDPDCQGACEICDMKDSWDFQLYVDSYLPGVLVA